MNCVLASFGIEPYPLNSPWDIECMLYIFRVLLGMTINCLALNVLDYSKTYFNWWNELPVDFMG